MKSGTGIPFLASWAAPWWWHGQDFHGAPHPDHALFQRCCNPAELGEDTFPTPCWLNCVFPHQAETPLSKPRCWLWIPAHPCFEIIPVVRTHGHPTPNRTEGAHRVCAWAVFQWDPSLPTHPWPGSSAPALCGIPARGPRAGVSPVALSGLC